MKDAEHQEAENATYVFSMQFERRADDEQGTWWSSKIVNPEFEVLAVPGLARSRAGRAMREGWWASDRCSDTYGFMFS